SALPIWADFMSAALTTHPEWTGDWQAPEGVQEADIEPATGAPAKADAINRRPEFFINDTLPGENVGTPEDMAQQNEGEEAEQTEPASLPPLESIKPKPTPKVD